MFVVVYIKSVKKNVVVPENWIYDINQELLKNKGVNKNRDVLVYWSVDGLIDDVPNGDYIPNFQAEKSEAFPLPAGVKEACYHARLIRYFGKKTMNKILYNFQNEKEISSSSKTAHRFLFFHLIWISHIDTHDCFRCFTYELQ